MHKRLALIIFGVFIAFSCTAFAQETSSLSTIEVTGSAKVLATPNVATISFAVETNFSKADDAVRANAERTERVLKALRSVCEKEAEIRTSGFSLKAVYDKGKRLHPSGYRVTNIVLLQTKELDKLGTFIDEASEEGASRIGSLVFSSSNEEQFKIEAAKKALNQAMGNAEDLAKAAGLKIRRIIKISYVPTEKRPLRQRLGEAQLLGGGVQTPIEIGQIPIESHVNMVFEVYK